MSRMYYAMPASSGPADDHSYRGEVRAVQPRIFTLPLFVAESRFEDDWRPAVGEYVEGSLWMQAYAIGRVHC